MSRFLNALLMGAIAATVAQAALRENRKQENQPMLKAVVHVNFADAERQGHGLKNIANILKEAPDSQIEVVCHGAGISLLVKDQTKHADQIQTLIKQGVQFAACQNTMKEKNISNDNLLQGITTVPSGAVEVIRKQQQGFGYFKP